jgi:hypothetical protein
MSTHDYIIVISLALPVLFAIVTAAVLFVIKRRLERSREAVLVGVPDATADLSQLNRIERAIYTSEVFWKDATGIIQDRLFRQLGVLVESVERFNRSLSAIPSTVDNRVPPAVAMVASALEDSSGIFRNAANTFQRAAENIASYGNSYSLHMDELRSTITEYARVQRDFESRLHAVLEERLAAERNLTQAINDQAESIRKGRVYIG